MEQVEENINRYLYALDAADLQESEVGQAKALRLKEKIASMKQQLNRLHHLQADVLAAPDQPISLTAPDVRAMAASMRGSGVVGYNVQAAVDSEHHLIVTHEVTNVVLDRAMLSKMALMAKEAMGVDQIQVLADHGYSSGTEILACDPIGAVPLVPKPYTSESRAAGCFA